MERLRQDNLFYKNYIRIIEFYIQENGCFEKRLCLGLIISRERVEIPFYLLQRCIFNLGCSSKLDVIYLFVSIFPPDEVNKGDNWYNKSQL